MDIAVGTVLPDTVTLVEVPNHPDFRYVKVKGKKIIVKGDTREVIQIY